MKKRISLRYQIFLREEPEGGYTVIVPSLPGCVSYGKTVEEAKEMAQEAIELYVESLLAHGEPIPEDDQVFVTTLQMNMPILKKKAYA